MTAVTAVPPGNGGTSGAVYELRDDGSARVVHDGPGTRIAAGNLSVPTLFVFTPPTYGGPKISRGLPDAIPFVRSVVDDSVVALSTDDHDVFFATKTAIARLDAAAASPTHMFNVDKGGLVAVDAASVFFEQKGTDSAIFRAVKNPLTGGIFMPAPERVATGYGDVAGLTLDAACVYFWSTPAAGGTSTLHVYPKTRTVLPGSVATTIKAPHTP